MSRKRLFRIGSIRALINSVFTWIAKDRDMSVSSNIFQYKTSPLVEDKKSCILENLIVLYFHFKTNLDLWHNTYKSILNK